MNALFQNLQQCKPIPFEKEFEREATYLMSLYAAGKTLRWWCRADGQIWQWNKWKRAYEKI